MTISLAVLQGGVTLSTSLTTLYTVPASTTAVVKKAVFTNTSGAAVTVTVSVTRSGGSAIAITSVQSVAAGAAYVAAELGNLVLATGDAIKALASSGAALNAFVSGYTVV